MEKVLNIFYTVLLAAAFVLLCLIPAFLIMGILAVLILSLVFFVNSFSPDLPKLQPDNPLPGFDKPMG